MRIYKQAGNVSAELWTDGHPHIVELKIKDTNIRWLELDDLKDLQYVTNEIIRKLEQFEK